MEDCRNETCTGTGIVLRFSFGMSLVSGMWCILLYGVESSKDPRGRLQNDFFSLKWLILGVVVVASFWLSNEDTKNYAYVSAVGSGFFIVFGIVLLLEWAHTWNDTWVQYYDDTGSKFWATAILVCAALLYGASITVWALLIDHFGGSDCDHTNAFVSLTIIFSVVVSITSVLEVVKQGAILPSAVITFYATFLCASAITDIPLSADSKCDARHQRVSDETQDLLYSVGIIFTILATGYATIRSASRGESLGPASKEKVKGDTESGEVTAEAEEDEEEATEYNYSFFHFVYGTGAMYLGMVLINWDLTLELKDETLGSGSSWTPVYIKMASQWCVFAIYMWSLVAPLILSDRDFS